MGHLPLRLDSKHSPCPQPKLQASTPRVSPILGSQVLVLSGLLLALILRTTFQDSMHFLHTLDHMTFLPITLGMSRDCLTHVLVYYIKPPELGVPPGRELHGPHFLPQWPSTNLEAV